MDIQTQKAIQRSERSQGSIAAAIWFIIIVAIVGGGLYVHYTMTHPTMEERRYDELKRLLDHVEI